MSASADSISAASSKRQTADRPPTPRRCLRRVFSCTRCLTSATRLAVEAFGVPSTEDIRRLRLELDKLLHTPPVDEEVARQKAMELAVLTLISVQMEEYEAHRLRSILGRRSKMVELDAELLRQGVQSVECQGDDVRVHLKNGQCLEA